jgi:hypothetical protein
MAEIKTKPGMVTVESFLEKLDDERQFEANELIDIMSDVSGEPPVMWGTSIVGFGKMNYTYASGRQLEWLRIGFSPRKGKISLYLTVEAEKYIPQLEKLGGKYSIGKGCIYLRKVNDVDTDKLRALIEKTYEDSKKIG